MTKAELENRVRQLEIKVSILQREQEGDIIRFQRLEIIADKYEEAALYLKVLVRIGKWGIAISGAVLTGAAWIKRSSIWQFLNP